jgi:hypothetical protein
MRDGLKRVDCIELYRESPTWQGLALTSRSYTSLPVVGSDSWVRPLNVGRGYLFMHCVYHLLVPRDTQSSHEATCHVVLLSQYDL